MEHDTTVHGLLPPNPSMPQVMMKVFQRTWMRSYNSLVTCCLLLKKKILRNCLKDRHARIQGVRRQVIGKDPQNLICYVSQSVSTFETQPAGVPISTPNGLI